MLLQNSQYHALFPYANVLALLMQQQQPQRPALLTDFQPQLPFLMGSVLSAPTSPPMPLTAASTPVDLGSTNATVDSPPPLRQISLDEGSMDCSGMNSISKNKLGRSYNPGRPLAMADRQRILDLYKRGHKISHIARMIGVTHSCVSKIMTRYRRTGSMCPRIGLATTRKNSSVLRSPARSSASPSSESISSACTVNPLEAEMLMSQRRELYSQMAQLEVPQMLTIQQIQQLSELQNLNLMGQEQFVLHKPVPINESVF
uniref:Paired domain-containing protein n=2 Tax=Bursaphelenchus xylophilus TaxID=6326 RepID=A0A1I7SCE1_BURXY